MLERLFSFEVLKSVAIISIACIVHELGHIWFSKKITKNYKSSGILRLFGFPVGIKVETDMSKDTIKTRILNHYCGIFFGLPFVLFDSYLLICYLGFGCCLDIFNILFWMFISLRYNFPYSTNISKVITDLKKRGKKKRP